MLCDDAFVPHLGGRSFEGRKAELGTRNMELLLERHPNYLDIVRAYIAADPLRAIRGAAMAKLRTATGPEHGVLHVIHGHRGTRIRRAVHARLRALPAVRAFRIAPGNEGMTIVQL